MEMSETQIREPKSAECVEAKNKLTKALKNSGIMVKGIEFVDEHDYITKAKAILEVVGNLRLVGETGTGKTTLVHKLAELLDVPLFEIVLTRDVTKWDLLACDTLKDGSTETREGIILQWLNAEKGLLYIDGFNYAEPSIISLLESLADFRGSVWIPELKAQFVRTAQHYLVISYNPSEKNGYSGTFLENIATIRRFEGLIIEYLSPAKERKLIKKIAGGTAKAYDFASKWVEIAKKTRTEYENGKLRLPLTTGNLINYAKLWNQAKMAEDDIIDIASSLWTAKEERELFRSFYETNDEIDVEKLKKQKEEDD
jgi:MoxR-like ATPase